MSSFSVPVVTGWVSKLFAAKFAVSPVPLPVDCLPVIIESFGQDCLPPFEIGQALR